MALLRLPDDLRGELKDPLGPVFESPAALLEEVEGPLITVGDVVTYHVEEHGRRPDVSLIDERTKREAVDEEIRAALGAGDVTVSNPAATLTEDLLRAIADALSETGPVRIMVDGEEDLAALPAIVAAPEGASVVYGQPGEGMVHVRVTPAAKDRARDLLERMDGDSGRALTILTER